ncbi:MAG: DNA replication and repair protein RecF [Magnetococcales bacterium]|nr:DNA replication and repair protein RecF [Magnetococcales bacterium]
MVLDWLRLQDFRNVSEAALRFNSRFNIIIGENGQGKSNLLEAIALLATGRSFRKATPEAMRRHGQPQYRLAGSTRAMGLQHRLEFSGDKNRQTARLNGKAMGVASALGQALAAVVSTPDSPGLIPGGPSERRDYLDWVVFSDDRQHAATVRDYNGALKARNRLLKTGCRDQRQLAAWEDRLAVLGAIITMRRRRIIEKIVGELPPYLEALALDPERFKMRLSCQLDRFAETNDPETLAERYRQMLEKSRSSDQRTGATSIGPHRDDIPFQIDGRLLARFGSRGQKKRFILALKLTEAKLLEQSVGEPPLILLDDPVAELDREGVERLIALLARQQQQVFLTACNAGELPRLEEPSSSFVVAEGLFKTLTEQTDS